MPLPLAGDKETDLNEGAKLREMENSVFGKGRKMHSLIFIAMCQNSQGLIVEDPVW